MGSCNQPKIGVPFTVRFTNALGFASAAADSVVVSHGRPAVSHLTFL